MDLDVGCRKRVDPLLRFGAVLPRTKPVGVSNDLMFSEQGGEFMDRESSFPPPWLREGDMFINVDVVLPSLVVIHSLVTFNRVYGTNYRESNRLGIPLSDRPHGKADRACHFDPCSHRHVLDRTHVPIIPIQPMAPPRSLCQLGEDPPQDLLRQERKGGGGQGEFLLALLRQQLARWRCRVRHLCELPSLEKSI